MRKEVFFSLRRVMLGVACMTFFIAGALSIGPVRAATCSWVGTFVRDSSGFLCTNVQGGSGSSTASPYYTRIQDGVGATLSSVFNGTGDTASTNAPSILSTTYNMGFNGTTWDRIRSVNTGQLVVTPKDAFGTAFPLLSMADALANGSGASSVAFNYGYNGTTWDRLRSYGTGTLQIGIMDGSTGANGARTGTAADNSGANTSLLTWAFPSAYNGTNWDRVRKDTYIAGPQWHTDGGASATAITANASSPQVIKASAGRVARIMITSSAAVELDCFDNASAATGKIIGVIASGAAVGTVTTFEMPAANGITCGGGATYPGYTISYW